MCVQFLMEARKMVSGSPGAAVMGSFVNQQLKDHFSYTVSSRLISATSDDPLLSQKKMKENHPLLQTNKQTKQPKPQLLENLDTTYSYLILSFPEETQVH